MQENNISSSDLILPIFIKDGKNITEEIPSMPGVFRYSLDSLHKIIDRALKNKIPAIALFPEINNIKKIPRGLRQRIKIT